MTKKVGFWQKEKQDTLGLFRARGTYLNLIGFTVSVPIHLFHSVNRDTTKVRRCEFAKS